MSWQAAFKEITAKTHSEQAKWWLNGFWEQGAEAEAEKIWAVTHKFMELSAGKPVLYGSRQDEVKETSDLDEFKAHVALEAFGETMTVQQLRKHLSALDIDNNKRLAVSEYLLNKYKKTPQQLVDSPQGTVKKEEMEAAQAAIDNAQAQLDTAIAAAAAAAAALVAAKQAQAKSDAAAEECRRVEAPLKKANEELQAVVDEIAALEKAKADKIASLEAIINDTEMSTTKKMKAKNELAQVKSEDSLPLQKAKITQAAALKRVEKARAPFKIATEAAEEEAAKALAAKLAAEEAEAAAAAGKAAAIRAFDEAQEALEELKKKGGTPHGAIWWMNRVLAEKKKFMPK